MNAIAKQPKKLNPLFSIAISLLSFFSINSMKEDPHEQKKERAEQIRPLYYDTLPCFVFLCFVKEVKLYDTRFFSYLFYLLIYLFYLVNLFSYLIIEKE